MNRIIQVPVRASRAEQGPNSSREQSFEAAPGPEDRAGAYAPVEAQERPETATAPQAGVDWHERALYLQAEMENYRKRQQRLARDQIQEEREQLLRGFLQVMDDLERALAASAGDGQGLRQGVQLTHQAALQWLAKEGVERVQAQNRPFDPAWQEAVSTVAHHWAQVAPNTVVQVLSPGYRQGDRLIRPAKVVVAV